MDKDDYFKIKAPWTADDVEGLNIYQRLGLMHPYTCGSKRQGDTHTDGGILVATPEGWKCPYCKYRQDWAHRSDLSALVPSAILGLRYALVRELKRAPGRLDSRRLGEIVKKLGEASAMIDAVAREGRSMKISDGYDNAPDIWLMNYVRPGAGGERIHDHGNSSAAIYVYRGEIAETIYAFDKADYQSGETFGVTSAGREAGQGSTIMIGAPYIHRLTAKATAITLNAYYPPLRDGQAGARYFVRNYENLAFAQNKELGGCV
jgi:hypothetical protein